MFWRSLIAVSSFTVKSNLIISMNIFSVLKAGYWHILSLSLLWKLIYRDHWEKGKILNYCEVTANNIWNFLLHPENKQIRWQKQKSCWLNVLPVYTTGNLLSIGLQLVFCIESINILSWLRMEYVMTYEYLTDIFMYQ